MRSLFLVQTDPVKGADNRTLYRYSAVRRIGEDDTTTVVAVIFRPYAAGRIVCTEAMAQDMQTTRYHIAKVVP